MKLEEDLYAYLWQNTCENNCNTYLIHGEVTILIDPGHSRHIPNLFQQMKGDGIPPEEIDLVILTHSHPDHFEGLEVFINQPVKIAMNRGEERYLMESGKLLFERMRHPLPEFRIDFYLKEGELHWGEETFHIYQTPGHSLAPSQSIGRRGRSSSPVTSFFTGALAGRTLGKATPN